MSYRFEKKFLQQVVRCVSVGPGMPGWMAEDCCEGIIPGNVAGAKAEWIPGAILQ